MARQSWPQAMAPALMAFMTPLLCVAALYGSGGKVVGFDDASDDLCALCGVTVVRHGFGGKRASIRAMRSVARLDGMRSRTRPPVSVSMRGASVRPWC